MAHLDHQANMDFSEKEANKVNRDLRVKGEDREKQEGKVQLVPLVQLVQLDRQA